MPTPRFSFLDLLALPPLDREVFLWVARNGPADAQAVAEATGGDAADIGRIVAGLIGDDRLRRLPDGRVEAAFGRVRSRTTLPSRLWPALLATERPYTQQEIATLRTAIPILQFARARMGEFADHGPGHALRVRSFAVQLGYLIGLTDVERHLLRVAALFHDVGNVVERARHHVVSEETVVKLAEDGELPFGRHEASLIGLLCRWHRGDYDPGRVDELNGEPVRTGLVASVLRVADAMDIDHRRSDYDERFRKVLQLFYPDRIRYWTSLEEIAGVRIRFDSTINLQVFTRAPIVDNMQIDMLRRDLSSTPFDWSVQEIALASSVPPVGAGLGRTLLAFPFDAHSLVMAALSRKHLAADGATVDLRCYPHLPDASTWLWSTALTEADPAAYARLVVIGDWPDRAASPHVVQTVRRWRAAGASVSILNRHEDTWSRLPELLALGAEATLGGDWAFFWGDAVDAADLAWGRIAAICVRDPTLATAEVAAEQRTAIRGLLKAIYDVLASTPPADGDGWRSCAEPILDRIAADDRESFVGQAAGFVETYAAADAPGRVDGQVLVFDRPPGPVPQSFPWILEAAIERHGRAPVRGLRFNVPHAIATWDDGEAVELLAMTHWREEGTAPIRLLYPDDVDPPHGNEHALRTRLPADRAPQVVARLIDACNRS